MGLELSVMQGKGGPGKGQSGCKDPDLEGVRCAPGLERHIPECWENGCWRHEGGSVITIPEVFLLLLAIKASHAEKLQGDAIQGIEGNSSNLTKVIYTLRFLSC